MKPQRRSREYRISRPEASRAQGGYRVCAQASDGAIWFESADTTLVPATEAYGSALWIPCLAQQMTLSLEGEVCPEWYGCLPHLADILRQWWNYPTALPTVPLGAPTARRSVASTGLCFSSGVDSFYTLLRYRQRIQYLLYIHGYDVSLEDRPRQVDIETSVRQVAAEVGAKAIFLRANLRQNATFSGVPFERAHGGGLVAAGHLLTDHLERLLISSSYPYDTDHPWGSHYRLDPLWSSARLEIVHFGAELWRSEKLRIIAGEPLVQEHLRVCWQYLNSGKNCSRCEKCLRTQLGLAACGMLDRFAAFDRETSLADRVDSLSHIANPDMIDAYRSYLEGELDSQTASAVRRLIERSRRRARSLLTARKKMKLFLRRAGNRLIRRSS
jgi:hypothetical protein